jgi:predicted RNA-binding protein YlxR (DUF448 family)/ribosomal protein L7Ae-like RNA K-turn-binding protein
MVEVEKSEHESTLHAGLREGSARVRTCVGCGERVELPRSDAPSSVLIRLVIGPSGEVAVDAAGGGFGRGAHVHPRPLCVERAAQKGLSRAARSKVSFLLFEEAGLSGNESTDVAVTSGSGSASGSTHVAVGLGLVPLDACSLSQAIIAALDRRVQGLLVAAARSRKIAPGTDAVVGADVRGQAALVLVATDAAAGAELSVVRRAISEGRGVAWGTKKVLGALCSAADSAKRSEGLAVIAIKDDRIGAAIREAVQAAAALLPLSSSSSARRSHPEGAAAGRKRHDAIRPGAGDGAIEVPRDVARSGRDRRADG